ncbi:MAG: FmdB family zinc ribbon protein [Acidimicrobiales bacterium]
MPTYVYRCQSCDDVFEVQQSFSDPTLTIHDACGGPVKKVFQPVGITFKGSGFYKNDNRGSSSTSTSSSDRSSDASTATATSSASSSASAPSSDSGSTTGNSAPTTAPAPAAPAASSGA